MEFDQLFNLGEGFLWISISIILLTRLRRARENRDLMWVGSVAFFFFGISDFIEIFTRAWYLPVSLLLLKGSCVVTLAACLAFYRRRRK